MSDFGKFVWSADLFFDGFSKNDGIGMESKDSISTIAITFVVFIAKFTDRSAKSFFPVKKAPVT